MISTPPIEIAIFNFPVNIQESNIVSQVQTILRDIALRSDFFLLSVVGGAENQRRSNQDDVYDHHMQ